MVTNSVQGLSVEHLVGQPVAKSSVSVIILSACGTVLDASAPAAASLGLAPAQLVGRPLKEFLDGGELMNAAMFRFDAACHSRRVMQSFRHSDGPAFHALVDLAPIRASDGHQLGIVASIVPTANPASITAVASAFRNSNLLMAAVAHDVRAPLHTILGATELLRQESGTLTSQRRELFDDIESSAMFLLGLITDVCDLLSDRSEQMNRDWELVSVADVVEASLLASRPTAEAASITIASGVVSQDLVLRTDGRRLKRVLVGLLDIAVKLTPPGGCVRLTVEDSPTPGAVFRIRDAGNGIPDSVQATLFEPFSPAWNAFIRQYGGQGLELTFVKAVIGVLKGTLSVRTRPGQGSEFSVCLPVSPVAGG